MQEIFKKGTVAGGSPPFEWESLRLQANIFGSLEVPHRWKKGCTELGHWILKARDCLRTGGKVNLKNNLPKSVKVIVAENVAKRNLEYQLQTSQRGPIDEFTRNHSSLLILTAHNLTATSFRSFFNRRVPLWEGYTRDSLEKLVTAISNANGVCEVLASAVVEFLAEVGKGFSPSAFGNRFMAEAAQHCSKPARGVKTEALQELALYLVEQPDHRGVARMLKRLFELKSSVPAFGGVQIDCYKEFWEAIGLGEFGTAEDGLAEITNRRTYSRPKPPDKAISIIHKAKGLECESVIVMPCDSTTFRDTWASRCLFYVAISRAKSNLMLVVSKNNQSPLLDL
jgi:DNA helicase-2/ATP-dependent DNA helicase PcrA